MKNSKTENIRAQFISNPVLGKNSAKINLPPGEFSVVETENSKL